MHIDANALRESLTRLREEPSEPDFAQTMRRVVASVNRLFDYDGAGIMLIDQDEQLAYVAASDDIGHSLEKAQAATGTGPCYDTFVNARPVLSENLRSDPRWPELARHLDSQIRAVAGVPIRLNGGSVGTLNVYRSEPTVWDESDVTALRAYADLIEEILAAALAAVNRNITVKQLQYALDYRVLIERAIGYLMASHGLDAATAFSLLRRKARDDRRRVIHLAAEILGDLPPSGTSPYGRTQGSLT